MLQQTAALIFQTLSTAAGHSSLTQQKKEKKGEIKEDKNYKMNWALRKLDVD